MQQFDTGATRNDVDNKPDYEGYLSPLALEAYGAYMTRHRKLPDGSMRASDNWQLGIPNDSYMKSMWRHLMTVWKWHRGGVDKESLEESLCGVIFNAMGRLHNLKKYELASRWPKVNGGAGGGGEANGTAGAVKWRRGEQMDPVELLPGYGGKALQNNSG